MKFFHQEDVYYMYYEQRWKYFDLLLHVQNLKISFPYTTSTGTTTYYYYYLFH